MISAANLVPDLTLRRSITADDLKRLQEPAVIFEYQSEDSDGVPYYVYTVAGWLDGVNVATVQGGCKVGGEAIVINADSRAHADYIAADGLDISIRALMTEEDRYLDAQAALARLGSINQIERLEQAIKPAADKSDAFVNDVDAIRPLIGDDILLTTKGGPSH